MSDAQLNFVLAAWCRYRCADGYLVELLVDHVQRLEHGCCRDLKAPYFESAVDMFPFVRDYAHHTKAIVVRLCKQKGLSRPGLVKAWLEATAILPRDSIVRPVEQQLNINLNYPEVG